MGWLGGNALPGLLAAAFWGVGDFSGGMGVKRAGGSTGAALRVVLMSHGLSFLVLLGILAVRGDRFPHGVPLVAGVAAGVLGGVSLTCFYVALSRGKMGVSAAISGVLAAGIPALVSGFSEGFAGWRRVLGFVVAGVAIWLIAAGENAQERASTVWLASAAGVGFGLYFVALKYAGPAGVFWPMATARMGSLGTCALILLGLRGGAGEVKVTRGVVGWVISTAIFDTSGNLSFVAATRAGRLDVAAVLASLYPVSTIVLAGVLLRERLVRRQVVGMGVALLAVVLVTV